MNDEQRETSVLQVHTCVFSERADGVMGCFLLRQTRTSHFSQAQQTPLASAVTTSLVVGRMSTHAFNSFLSLRHTYRPSVVFRLRQVLLT